MMSQSGNPTESIFEKISKRIGVVLSVLAFALSLYNFINQHFANQHVLRVAVIALHEDSATMNAKLLLVNAGKNYETLYGARFLFNGTTYGKATLGPLVLKPGEARVEILSEPLPSAKSLRDGGILNPQEDKLHIAVEFLPVTRDGKLQESGTVYGFTQWQFSGDMKTGAAPIASDLNGLVDLKL